MDIHKRVYLKPDFILEKIGNEITVYHPTITTSIYLNETGALIWELCDGERRVKDIIEILQKEYPENHDQIEEGVTTIVSQLATRDIVELID